MTSDLPTKRGAPLAPHTFRAPTHTYTHTHSFPGAGRLLPCALLIKGSGPGGTLLQPPKPWHLSRDHSPGPSGLRQPGPPEAAGLLLGTAPPAGHRRLRRGKRPAVATGLFMPHSPRCGSAGKESTCNAGELVRSLGWEDPPEKEMATLSSALAWKILWTEEPGRLQSMGSQSHN